MVFGLQTQPKSWLTGYTFWVNHYLEIVFSKISVVNPPPPPPPLKELALEDLLSSSGFSTVDSSTAMCDVNHIKKARHSGQVVAPVLGALLRDAYKEAKAAEDKSKAFDLWCKE